MQEIHRNNSEKKKLNRSNVFIQILRGGPQSKQDIANKLRISFPTVSQSINELYELGLVIDAGVFESSGGRKAQAIAINPNAYYAIGLDITRNHVGVVVVDLLGNVLNSFRERLSYQNAPSYFQTVGQFISNIIEDSGIDARKVLGVGIAVPAIVSPDHTLMVYSPVLGVQNGDLKSFAAYIPFPCTLCNDANAGGFAETWKNGVGNDILYISLNNSVGGSIFINNKICLGSNERAGEIGHMTLVPNGEPCYCGKLGCFDAYCNAKILSSHTNGNLHEFFNPTPEQSQKHAALLDEYLDYLALAINNLYMAFDCDIILGGYVGVYLDAYLTRLREMVAVRNTFELDGSYLKVCKYCNEATAVGAAMYYIDAFIKSV